MERFLSPGAKLKPKPEPPKLQYCAPTSKEDVFEDFDNTPLNAEYYGKLKKALDRKESIGIVVDQEARKGPVFAPFFGILAASSPTPALLHLKTRAPIAVATVHRLAPFRYELRIDDVIEHAPTDDKQADLLAITTRINRAMEAAIRRHPVQWLWSHRRWRRRPPGETVPFAREHGSALELKGLMGQVTAWGGELAASDPALRR